MADLVGKKLKDFFVLRRLGRGAMAEVYLAQQLSLGRQVALKVLNAELARDPNYVRRFHHEARAAAALVHAGIVQIYEVGQDDSVHFIAQEYVAGRNLGEVIRSHGSLAPQLVLDILRQVAAALTKASSQGIVHRDIKPENIMVAAATGEVKVADFGLARVQGDGGANLTQVGVTMGTPLYMSPEQIEGREIDSRSDIYSLGVTAYHMLSGEPPFGGDSPLTVAVQHLNQPAKPLNVAGLSEAGGTKLSRIIERMMAKKPADRFRDPSALLEELNSLLTQGIEQGWAARPDHGSLAEILQAADERAVATSRLDELMKTTALARPKRAPWGWIAAAIAGCALLGAAGAAMLRPPSLLAGAQSGPAQSDDVWGQLYQAKLVDTEEGWLAVAKNFPDLENEYCHNLARQGLVYHYLTRTQDYEKAIQPSEELTTAAQPAFQAFGRAGLIIAYVHLGDDDEAYYANQRLTSDMRTILNQQSQRMSQLLNQALDELADRAL
ncbi:MAG: serine/threonine protein kinase [Planctomycetes bacterium]|nr:serine/threonine protein kinase [Planctomycetota bacterium]